MLGKPESQACSMEKLSPSAYCYNFPPSACMLNFSKDTNMSNDRTRVHLGVLWRAWQECYTPKLLQHALDK